MDDLKKELENRKPTLYTSNEMPSIVYLKDWSLTKCYDGAVINSLTIHYGNKQISILLTDDLYQEIKKMMEEENE